MRKQLLRVDALLGDAERILPFGLTNPDNVDTIKKHFFRKPFNPDFTYAEPPRTDELERTLKELYVLKTPLAKLLLSERDELLKKIYLYRSLGTPSFAKNSKLLYGFPSKKQVVQAKEFLLLPRMKKKRTIPYSEVKKILDKTFSLLGFKYSIKRKPLVTSAYLRASHQELTLKSKERFSQLFAYRLAVHEIATHALRAENGRKQKLQIFQRGTAGYLATEEGLAAYNEERAGVMTSDFLRNYAGRTVAVWFAQKHTFVETFHYLKEFFVREDAFRLTLRAKRGLRSGEDVGSCTKDHVYLKGYMDVKDYVLSGNSLTPLYAGKIGLDDLGLLKMKYRFQPASYTPERVIDWVRGEMITR